MIGQGEIVSKFDNLYTRFQVSVGKDKEKLFSKSITYILGFRFQVSVDKVKEKLFPKSILNLYTKN